MADSKKDAKTGRPDASSKTDTNIAKEQSPKQNLAGYEKRSRSVITKEHRVNSLAIKAYDEQLPNGWDHTSALIQSIDSSKMQVLGIRHDRDLHAVDNNPDEPELDKVHYHIILRFVDKHKNTTVNSLLNQLGVHYRISKQEKELDRNLWVDHGVEPVVKFSGYAMYLTHETDQAIADGKAPYDVSEIVSNLTQEEIMQIREGYIRPSEKRRATQQEMAALRKEAYQLGFDLKDFNSWWDDQPYYIVANAGMRIVEKSYCHGMERRLSDKGLCSVIRLCVYIKGPANVGKTYAAEHSLGDRPVYIVRGGGTGKFDGLKASDKAIIIDDDSCPHILNMTDNYFCKAYRRGSNNPPWTGDLLIVTSNLEFDDWLHGKCGLRTNDEAVKSRFYICEVDQNPVPHLTVISPSKRGTPQEQRIRLDMFLKFREMFNNTIKQYVYKADEVDYSVLKDSNGFINEGFEPWPEGIETPFDEPEEYVLGFKEDNTAYLHVV